MQHLASTHVRRLWCRRAALALSLACGFFAGGAQAADPNVAITVTPIPASVNLRVGDSTTQAAYLVQIVNNSTNVLNDVRFTARTRIDPAASPAGTKYVEDDSALCGLTSGSQTELTCSFGQLRGARQGGQNSAGFVVVFEAPSTGAKLFLDWSATYQEGATDNSGSSSPTNDSQNSNEPGKAVFTTLVTSTAVDDKRLRSYFAASTGALLFTSTGVPSGPPSADSWTTTVKIPTGSADEAQIVEDNNGGQSCTGVLPLCLRSAVSVPGSFADAGVGFLVITLRRDASTIPNGAKINAAPLLYEPGTLDTSGMFHPSFPPSAGFPVSLKLCSALIGGAPSMPDPNTPPALAAQQKRCIKSFQAYPTNNKAPPGLQGDWEWVIWAIENGRISF